MKDMKMSEIAKAMGRKGGQMRAKRLSSARRIEIARLGAQARTESFRLARLIESNFEHLSAIRELRNAKTKI